MPLAAAAQSVHYTNFTTRYGLLSNMVYNVIEDRNGFIWLATNRGVSRYDGVSFTNYTSDQGLPDNDVLRVFEDSVGRIWFLSFAAEPGYYLNGKIYNALNDSFLGLLKQTRTNTPSIYAIDIVSNQLYFRIPYEKEFAFACKDNSRKIKVRNYSGTDGVSAIYMYSFPTKTIFVDPLHFVTKQNNALSISSYPFVHLGSIRSKTKSIVFSDANTGKSGQLNILNQSTEYYKEDSVIFSYYSNELERLYLLKKGYVKILGENIAQKSLLIPLRFHAKTLMVGKNGNMWFTSTDKGIFLVKPNSSLGIYNTEDGNTSVISLAAANKNLYIGTNGNGLLVSKAGRITGKLNYKPENTERIMRIALYRNNIYFGTDRGLMKLSEGRTTPECILQVSIKDIELGYNGELLVAASGGNYRLWDGLTQKPEPIGYGRSTSICRIDSSQIWYGKLQGLYCYKTDKRPYTIFPLITHTAIDRSYINDIKKDLNGNVWIATSQEGLFFYNPQCGFISVNQSGNHNPALSSNLCNQIFVDSLNRIWVANAGGLGHITYTMHKAIPSFSILNYTYVDGIPDKEVNDVVVNDGEIIIATTSGCYKFVPSKVPDVFTSRTFISGIRVNGRVFTGDLLQLMHNENNLIFNFAASFIQAASIQYHFKYRIKGTDAHWIDIYGTQVPFYNLPPGQYILEVAAIGNKDQAGPISTLAFTIHAAWYKSTWFLLLGLLCVIVLLLYFLLSERKKLTLAKHLVVMKMKVLRAQINPHFIFNTLSNIQNLIYTKQYLEANKYLSDMASIMRRSIQYSTEEMIPLAKEIEYTQNYLRLEKLRFQDKFDFNITVNCIDQDVNTVYVPPLILQPIIENSIKHGFRGLAEGGKIEIIINQMDAKHLEYLIKDNGCGFDTDAISKKSYGLGITKQRIELLYRNLNLHASFTVHTEMKAPANGTTLQIILPIIKE